MYELNEGMGWGEMKYLLNKKYPHLDFSKIELDNLNINPKISEIWKKKGWENGLKYLFSKIENNYAILVDFKIGIKDLERPSGHTAVMGKEDDIPFLFDPQHSILIKTIPNIIQELIDDDVIKISIIIGKDKITGEIYKDDYSLGL